jgi:hypothetical protein
MTITTPNTAKVVQPPYERKFFKTDADYIMYQLNQALSGFTLKYKKVPYDSICVLPNGEVFTPIITEEP